MNAQRWFGRHAGEALGSPVRDVAAQVQRAGLAVRVVGAVEPPAAGRRRCITLVGTSDGTVTAVQVR